MIQASKPLTVVSSKIRLTGLIGKTNARGTTGLMYSWGSLRHITTSGSAKATVQLATSAVDPGGMASGRAQASPHFGVDLHALPFNTGSPRGEPYWQKIPQWKDVSEQDFLSFQWQVAHTL